MDPLGPCLLTLLCLAPAAAVYALNGALPTLDEAALESRDDARSRRWRRLLRRFDAGHGEIRTTYALLVLLGYLPLRRALAALIASALPIGEGGAHLAGALAYALIAFTLTAIVPGSAAVKYPQAALRLCAFPAEAALTLFTPITFGAWFLGAGLLKPFRVEPSAVYERVTEQEIRQMVDLGEEKGAIETDEKEMIENIFEFNNMNAGDVMIHRKDITAVDLSDDDDEVFAKILESGLSRFPVYEDSIDNIIGLITSRDFLINRCSDHPAPLKSLIRPAHFVPESVRTDVLFHEMQSRKQHMAIVIDEYGGTSGLITLEDLLEEIVGNIYDEYDPKEDESVTALPDGRWRVSGSTELETLGEALGVDLPLTEDYDTLGGLVFSHLTEIPADGERPVVECCGLRISVTEVADRRVEWAIVEKLDNP